MSRNAGTFFLLLDPSVPAAYACMTIGKGHRLSLTARKKGLILLI